MEQWVENDEETHSPVFLVERGDCHFVTKVRNIAYTGGKMAIIIDNQNENITKVIMSDDGTGAGIRIPSVLIGRRDGKKIKEWFETASAEDKTKVNINV